MGRAVCPGSSSCWRRRRRRFPRSLVRQVHQRRFGEEEKLDAPCAQDFCPTARKRLNRHLSRPKARTGEKWGLWSLSAGKTVVALSWFLGFPRQSLPMPHPTAAASWQTLVLRPTGC
ncbi:protein of unknown function [Methylacidimicrobium sp. AP8]|nr:protein of unknown function [Methylacidimicrobium sp. AP8]